MESGALLAEWKGSPGEGTGGRGTGGGSNLFTIKGFFLLCWKGNAIKPSLPVPFFMMIIKNIKYTYILRELFDPD